MRRTIRIDAEEDASVLRIIKPCKACREMFSYSQEEEAWLKNRGLAPYERCPNCRKKEERAKC